MCVKKKLWHKFMLQCHLISWQFFFAYFGSGWKHHFSRLLVGKLLPSEFQTVGERQPQERHLSPPVGYWNIHQCQIYLTVQHSLVIKIHQCWISLCSKLSHNIEIILKHSPMSDISYFSTFSHNKNSPKLNIFVFKTLS